MKIIALVFGTICVLLGGLWLLQGLGIVQIPPILCVGECEPLKGPSPGWAIAGFLVAAAGGLALGFGLRRRAPSVD